MPNKTTSQELMNLSSSEQLKINAITERYSYISSLIDNKRLKITDLIKLSDKKIEMLENSVIRYLIENGKLHVDEVDMLDESTLNNLNLYRNVLQLIIDDKLSIHDVVNNLSVKQMDFLDTERVFMLISNNQITCEQALGLSAEAHKNILYCSRSALESYNYIENRDATKDPNTSAVLKYSESEEIVAPTKISQERFFGQANKKDCSTDDDDSDCDNSSNNQYGQ